jgi:hypothetical protein
MKYMTTTVVGFGFLGAAVLASGSAGAFGNPSGTLVVAPQQLVPDCVTNGNSFQCVIDYTTWLFGGGGSSGAAVEVTSNPSNHTYWDGVDLKCNGASPYYMPWRGTYDNSSSNPNGLNWWYCPSGTSPTEAFGDVCDLVLYSNSCSINIPF